MISLSTLKVVAGIISLFLHWYPIMKNYRERNLSNYLRWPGSLDDVSLLAFPKQYVRIPKDTCSSAFISADAKNRPGL